MNTHIDQCGLILLTCSAIFTMFFVAAMTLQVIYGLRNIRNTPRDKLTGKNVAIWIILMCWLLFFVMMYSSEHYFFVQMDGIMDLHLCFQQLSRKFFLALGICGVISFMVFNYHFRWLTFIECWIKRKFFRN